MGLKKFKSLKEARDAMVEEAIAESINNPHRIETDQILPNMSSYRSGLYRFKTWEDAHKFDMELMIRKSCKGKAA
jgi:hypothetical protein